MQKLRPLVFSFWESCPALYYAVAALCGIALFYGYYLPLLLVFTQPKYPNYIGFLLIGGAMYGYVTHQSYRAHLDVETTGRGYLQISRIQTSPYNPRQKVYHGTLVTFVTDQGAFYQLPVSFSSSKQLRIKADCDYTVHATVTPKARGYNSCKLKTATRVPGTWSLAQWRFNQKQALKKWIKAYTSNTYCKALYGAFLTGEGENTLLSFLFARIGLQHALAISGFHYACLAGVLAYLLQRVFSRRTTAAILILFCTSYLFFMGSSPSLCRAYVALIVYLLGYVLLRNTTPLNALGVALLISLILNPTICQSVGFQLSYLATFAILTLAHPTEQVLQKAFPRRSYEVLAQWPLLEQAAYLALRVICKLLSVNFAIHLCLIPLLLGHFQSFSLLGLLYNLCIPPLLTVTLALLLLSVLFFPLAPYLFALNNAYTQWIINRLLYIPLPFNFTPHLTDIPIQPILAWTLICFLAGMFSYELKRIDEKMPI